MALSIGNHDAHDTTSCPDCSTDAGAYFDYLFNEAPLPKFGPGSRGEGWYAYSLGAWKIIVLNSECNGTPYDFCDQIAQLNFLQNELLNAPLCTLIYFHRTIISAGDTYFGIDANDGSGSGHLVGNPPAPHTRNVWEMAYDYGADLIVTGHEHVYQRYARLSRDLTQVEDKAQGSANDGVSVLVVGTGGRGVSGHNAAAVSDQTTTGNVRLQAYMYSAKNSQNSSTTANDPKNNNLGIIKLSLHPGSWDWQFLPQSGKTYNDSGSRTCRNDRDGDTWTDGAEGTIGTDPLDACANTRARNDEPLPDAWPADFDDDAISDITDISVLTGAFGEAVPPSPARNDVAPEMPDGFVDITDIARLTGIFGAACPSGLPPFSPSGPFSPVSGGAQPKMSLDMITTGNTYADVTNTMVVGPVDHCLASLLGDNMAHNHIAHLTLQDVTDLVGWQARLHYQGGKMRPLNVNYTPFTDTTTGQDLGFVNLPKDEATGEHRDITSASSIPAAQPGAQTALVGAAYNGAQSAEISPDTPPKIPPDDTSYTAPSGGVLAAVNIRVEAGQSGQQLLLSVDGAFPNPPGSSVVVFTETGTATMDLDGGALWDGVHAEGIPCEPAPP